MWLTEPAAPAWATLCYWQRPGQPVSCGVLPPRVKSVWVLLLQLGPRQVREGQAFPAGLAQGGEEAGGLPREWGTWGWGLAECFLAQRRHSCGCEPHLPVQPAGPQVARAPRATSGRELGRGGSALTEMRIS